MNSEIRFVRRLHELIKIKQRVARLNKSIYKWIKQVMQITDVNEVCVNLRNLRIHSVFER